MAKKQRNTLTMPPRNAVRGHVDDVQPINLVDESSLPPAMADELLVDAMPAVESKGGLLTVPIKVAMLEPTRFVGPIRLSFDADGERARTIQRLQHGMNARNMRKGNGRHVASIASVVEYLLDEIASRYAAESELERADHGERIYVIPLALSEPTTFVRPVTVWYRAHGTQAKTLQRLRLGMDAHHFRLSDGRHVESYESVIRYLIDQIASDGLPIQKTMFSPAEALVMNGTR